MNERMRELAWEAGLRFSTHNVILAGDRSGVEKFAELIVRECARISNEADDTMTNQGEASAQAFKEYFGVEE